VSHEDLTREQSVEGSSDRAFGLVFAAVFLLIAGWPLWYGQAVRWWSVGAAAAFALAALLKPSLLARPNRLWTRLGLVLGKIVSPLALGLLYYAVLAPVGLLVRLTGKDPLRLRRDPAASSYWIARKPPGPPPDSMTKQF
jgi:hypothetical protein